MFLILLPWLLADFVGAAAVAAPAKFALPLLPKGSCSRSCCYRLALRLLGSGAPWVSVCEP